jgi:RNA polymerase sigma-70 factor, ECF subfamily
VILVGAPSGSVGMVARLQSLCRAAIDPFGRLARSFRTAVHVAAAETRAEVRPGSVAGASLLELTSFVGDNYDRLVRLAGLVCRSVPDAEDAVQTALERAWRNRGSIRDPERLKPWLDRIVVREAIRITRSRESLVGRLRRGTDDDIEIEITDGRAPDAVRTAELRAAFARLSAEQRAVVALHLYAGYSVVETAELVGAPVETARSRLRLARQRLRMELEPA